jgi:acyl-CoA synthetase (AMP-forming)/AMP-acid ligase II
MPAGATTLDAIFTQVAAKVPDSEAVLADDIRITYGELATLVERCARALAASGVRHGDRVAILSPPRPEALIVLLACARLGAIYLGLGTRFARAELDYVLRDATPRLVFSIGDFDGREYEGDVVAACAAAGVEHSVVLTLRPDMLAPEFLAFLESGGATDAPAAAKADDPLAIIYTSGTTGPPKGALISHRGILTAVAGVLPRLALSRVRALGILPIDHVGFLANEAVKVIVTGGAVIQLRKFDPPEVLRAIERHRATLWCAIPTMLQRLAASNLMDDYDLSSLELVWWPGSLPKHVFELFRRKSRRVGVSYGMTEASGGITFSKPDDDPESLLNTVGAVVDQIEVRIADDPSGAAGPGEILLRGRQLMLGYWNKPDETERAFADGWFRTGDLGELVGGRLKIVGRLKELIRTGGYNVSPTEVERVIGAHPGVGFVVVLGIPDAQYGEAVHAVWSPRPGAMVSDTELEQQVRGQLAGYKVPKRFWRRSELPFLGNGKLDRDALRRQIQAESQAAV